MKLLILTQKIDQDDDVLGFFHSWIAQFAKHCELVTAIGLSVGACDLPKNVHVFSLGKESEGSRLHYVFNFYRLIIRERKNYDAVFVHMNPEYVILGGIFWKAMRKKVGLWYTHKNVDLKLRLAAHGVDVIFTASPESFRLKSAKCHVVGHGIDTARFRGIKRTPDGVFRILSIGRLSRTKGYGVLLDALSILKDGGSKFEALLIGGSVTAPDRAYRKELFREVARHGLWGGGNLGIVLSSGVLEDSRVLDGGAQPNSKIGEYLARADLFVNMSQTGSLDKAVLEAMAAGVPVLTSNEGLQTALTGFEKTCMFKERDAKDFSEHIRTIMQMTEDDRRKLGERLRSVVEKSHNLKTLIPKILELF
ncbi:MAG: glycosyltransferase family 4 protein [Patescibacteria group bacterium]